MPKKNRALKDIYVNIHRPTTEFELIFTVTFPDNCEKTFKVTASDFRAKRCGERDFVENTILDFYEELGEIPPKFQIFFL